MKVPFTGVTLPKGKIYDLMWGFYPIVLFYGMLAVVKFNFITRDIDPPQGEILGMFLFAIPSFFISAIFYKPIDSFTRSKRRLGKALYQFVSYPIEFLFYNALMLGLQADNMPRLMKTDIFMFLFVLASSCLERIIILLLASRPPGIAQEVMQEAFLRSMAVFLVFMVSFFLFWA